VNVTIDANCIIDIEENKPVTPYLRMLIDLHEGGKISLRVVALGISERKPDGIYAFDFNEFRDKITAMGLGDVDILKPICHVGITFFDWCLAAGVHMVELERKIQKVLFPDIEYTYENFCRKRDLDPNSVVMDWRWMKAKCDVLMMWSHIWYGSGIYVTSDEELHKYKKSALIALGAGEINRPEEILVRLTIY